MLLKELFEGNLYYVDSAKKRSVDLSKLIEKDKKDLTSQPNVIGIFRFSDGSKYDFYTGDGKSEQRSFKDAAKQATDMYCREYDTDYCRLILTQADFRHRG